MMGWREVLGRWASGEFENADEAEATAAQVPRVLFGMLDHDRIALARELLAGTGRVVAEPRDPRPLCDVGGCPAVEGLSGRWLCRYDHQRCAIRVKAAMLGDEG